MSDYNIDKDKEDMNKGRYKDRPEALAVNPKILKVAKRMSATLTKRGVKHALIGGLAVGAHGYSRATKDVDFLVASEFAEQIAGDSLGGEVEGKTVIVDGVDVDLLFPKPEQDFLDDAVVMSPIVDGIPTVVIEVLIYLKLVGSRARDNGDVVELVKRGKVDIRRVEKYLARHRPDLVEDFQSLVVQAEHEED